MEDSTKPTGGNKWNSRLTIFFLILFAIFWSLGSFFFWILLGFAASFGFLALNSSGINLPSFHRTDSQNPFQFVREATKQPEPQKIPLKLIRIMALGIGVILMISVFTRLFFEGNSESSPESITNENSESVPTEDNPSFTDKGNTFFNEAQYDSALLYYEKALALDPGDQYAQYNRALVFFMKKEFRKSITLIRKCLREHPDYNEALWLLGDGYSSINNFDSAAVCLERAYRNDFNDPNFLQLMGDVYREQNNLSKSAEFYKKVILQDTTKVEVYQQLIDLDPDNADLYRQKLKGLSTN